MKILIIGGVASGKTTYAKKLSKDKNIKYYEIDSIVYDENNLKRDLKKQDEIVNKINQSSNWIIEGVLRKNLYYLLDDADQIIYLDTPLLIKKFRIVNRLLKQNLKLEKCSYKPTIMMLKKMFTWVNEDEKNKKDFINLLNKYQDKLIIRR
jgi:adenylate kinase family enzyme